MDAGDARTHAQGDRTRPLLPSPGTGLVDLSRKTAPSERKIRSYVSGDCRKSSDPNSVPIKSTGPTPGEGRVRVIWRTRCTGVASTWCSKSPSPPPSPGLPGEGGRVLCLLDADPPVG